MSKIEWTDRTWNPIVGCSVVSPGCTNCYAMKQAARLLDKPGSHYEGTTEPSKGGQVWTGKVARAPEKTLAAPLHWRKPCRVFVNSMGDLFHEDVPDEWIDRVFAVMALAPQHTFQILTKRANRMREYAERADESLQELDGLCTSGGIAAKEVHRGARWWQNKKSVPRWPLPNVWLGVSAEDQARADERIPLLLDTPAAVRFISYEPALGPVRLQWSWIDRISHRQEGIEDPSDGYLDQIIVGGESGSAARPCDIDWVRSIINQCKAAGVAVFVKQLGARPRQDIAGRRMVFNLRDRKGGDMSEWPSDLRVREFPDA